MGEGGKSGRGEGKNTTSISERETMVAVKIFLCFFSQHEGKKEGGRGGGRGGAV